MHFFARLFLAVAAVLPAACCCSGGSAGFPKPDGKPHGNVTVEATTAR